MYYSKLSVSAKTLRCFVLNTCQIECLNPLVMYQVCKIFQEKNAVDLSLQ